MKGNLDGLVAIPTVPSEAHEDIQYGGHRSQQVQHSQNSGERLIEVKLYIQVQVVEDALFDILLEQPFFAVAGAQTSHSTSEEQLITLKDQNSGSVVTLATKGKGEGF